ncbi:hypothetical protein ACHAXS_005928 [Conticribra weissflogii]
MHDLGFSHQDIKLEIVLQDNHCNADNNNDPPSVPVAPVLMDFSLARPLVVPISTWSTVLLLVKNAV